MENDPDDATSVSSTLSPTLQTSISSPVVHNQPRPIKIGSSSHYENDPNSSRSRLEFSAGSRVDPSFLDSKKSTPATTLGSASSFQNPVQVTNASKKLASSQNQASDPSPNLIPSHPANSASAQVAQALPSFSPYSYPSPGTPTSVHVVPGPYTQAMPTSSVSQSDVTAHIMRNQLLQSSLNNSQSPLALSSPANMHTSPDAYLATSGPHNVQPSTTPWPQHVHSPTVANNTHLHATRAESEEGSESSSNKWTALKVIGKGLKGVAKLFGYGIESITFIPVNDIVADLAILFERNRKSKRKKLRDDLQLVLEGAQGAPYAKVIKELEKAKKSQRKRTKQSTLLKSVIEIARRQEANARQPNAQAIQAAQPAHASHIQSAVQGGVLVNSHFPYGVPNPSMSGIPLSAAQQPTSMSSYHGVSPGQSSGTHSTPSPTSGDPHHSAQKPRKMMGGGVKKTLADIASQISTDDSDQDND
ncbi:hypothetical protein H0H92_007261 [Tricholoma furcatifolium]|nr:hypothetical protein H0H92_007261 [Tricholoma furcatifolium]